MQLSNFTGKTVAIMVASGFDEDTFIAIQRAMMSVNAKLRVISRDTGLTNAWNGSGWGMSYPRWTAPSRQRWPSIMTR